MCKSWQKGNDNGGDGEENSHDLGFFRVESDKQAKGLEVVESVACHGDAWLVQRADKIQFVVQCRPTCRNCR